MSAPYEWRTIGSAVVAARRALNAGPVGDVNDEVSNFALSLIVAPPLVNVSYNDGRWLAWGP